MRKVEARGEPRGWGEGVDEGAARWEKEESARESEGKKEEVGTHLAPSPTPIRTPQMPTRCHTLSSTVAPNARHQPNHPCFFGRPSFPSSLFSPFAARPSCSSPGSAGGSAERSLSPSAPLLLRSRRGGDSLASAGSSSPE